VIGFIFYDAVVEVVSQLQCQVGVGVGFDVLVLLVAEVFVELVCGG